MAALLMAKREPVADNIHIYSGDSAMGVATYPDSLSSLEGWGQVKAGNCASILIWKVKQKNNIIAMPFIDLVHYYELTTKAFSSGALSFELAMN